MGATKVAVPSRNNVHGTAAQITSHTCLPWIVEYESSCNGSFRYVTNCFQIGASSSSRDFARSAAEMSRAPLYRARGSPGSSWKMKKLTKITKTKVPRPVSSLLPVNRHMPATRDGRWTSPSWARSSSSILVGSICATHYSTSASELRRPRVASHTITPTSTAAAATPPTINAVLELLLESLLPDTGLMLRYE